MKKAARTATCIELINAIENARVPMDLVIGDFMRPRRYIGAKDRQAIVETVYSIMRAHARLGWWLARCEAGDSPRTRVIAWLVLAAGYNDEQLEDLFDAAKYSPSRLSDDECALAGQLVGRPLTHESMPGHVRLECPAWAYSLLSATMDADQLETLFSAMLVSAPLDLRVNTLLASVDKAKAFLEADGVITQPTPYAPAGLRCEGRAFLAKTKAFNKGMVEIQDEGAQLIARACDVQAGEQVLDFCAGAGGKTLALAADMGGGGRIVAMDSDPDRLEKARPRLRRARAHDMVEIRPLSEARHRKWLKRQKGGFDCVLTDVPCSGTGTWRRNPDLRWHDHVPSLDELQDIQADILVRVADKVRSGGRLVYATCSLLPQENEEQVHAFLDRHPEFRLAPPPNVPADKDGFMRLSPDRHGTDGFFAAVLIREL